MRRAAQRNGLWPLLVLAALLLRCPPVCAVPLLVNYQGTVDWTTPEIATVEMEFRVYGKPTPAATADAFLWGKRYEVRIDHGKFNVIIGSDGLPDVVRGLNDENPVSADLGDALAHAPCTLGICVVKGGLGEKQELTPRQTFPVAPRAVVAQRVLGNATVPTIPPPRYAINTDSPFTTPKDLVLGVRPGALVRIDYYANIFYQYASFQLVAYTQNAAGAWSAEPTLLEPLIAATTAGRVSGTATYDSNETLIAGTRLFAPPPDTVAVNVRFNLANPNQLLVGKEGYDAQFLTVEEVLNGNIQP